MATRSCLDAQERQLEASDTPTLRESDRVAQTVSQRQPSHLPVALTSEFFGSHQQTLGAH